MNTKIIACTCKHEYQDTKYGKNNRVHNATSKVNPIVYRCTVCNKTSN